MTTIFFSRASSKFSKARSLGSMHTRGRSIDALPLVLSQGNQPNWRTIMNSLNDGNLKTGFGDDILLLEPNEYVSLKSRGKALPGSVTAIRNTRNVVIGQVFNKD